MTFLRTVLASATLGALGFAGPVACTEEPEPTPPSQTAKDYTVRGRVLSLPDPDDPRKEFMVHHEAIDDFVGADGVVVGMNAMQMPFSNLADGVTFDGLESNDIIQLTFRVDWQARPRMQVTEIRELPADTELVFRAAEPAP